MSILKRLLMLLLCLRMVLLYGQNYPVQVSLQLAPPYTPQLSALYTDPGRMGITLLNKDLATPMLSVYLQLKLEGPGITLQTRAGYRSPAPVLLTAGIPQMLGGAEIADLLQAANLDFQGLDRNRFLQAGQLLPEGLWRFSVTAFSTDRALQVSNTGSISMGLFKHKPPILNFPVDGARSGSQLPQYVLFQWTPRHYASPFAAGSIRYRLRLVELVPNNRNPNEAMQSSLMPLFETITEQTSYAYGPADPPLFPGRGYAWQVQALDVDGSDLFEQDGYSQVSNFVFGDACGTPQAFSLQADAGRSFTARWRGSTAELSNAAYLLWYRQVGMPVWQTVMVADTLASVGGLLPNTTYEARVTRLCLGGESAPTGTLTITTTQEQGAWDAKSKSCGKPAPQFDLSNRTPLAVLNAGESFTAADFTIKVLSAQGQNGEFSGSGLVLLPFTGKVPIPCTWEAVSINADRRLISGNIRILQQPLVLSNLSIEKLSDRWRDLFGSNWNRTAYKRMDAAVLGVENTGDGRIRIRTATGEETLFGGKNTVITDPAGKRWYVSAGGKITGPEGPAEKPIVADDARGEGMPGSVLPDGSMVVFGPSQKNALAWDEYAIRNQTGGSTYDRLDGPPGGYMAGWKLLKTGGSEIIIATLRKGKVNLHPDSTRFLRSDGVRIKSERIDDSTWKLLLPGRLHLWSDAAWAVGSIVPTDSVRGGARRILGKLNLIAADERKVFVKLIPVGNSGGNIGKGQMEAALNAITAKYGVKTGVEIMPSMAISGYNPQVDKISVNRMVLKTSYGSDLQRFIKEFEGKYRSPGNDTAVMFLLGPAADQTEGYMALNNRYGFIFCGNSPPEAHTIAHELGHGLLVLEHPFEESAEQVGKTLNLMDYRRPHALTHFQQWKRIHDKEEVGNFLRGVMQKEEEGRYVAMHVEELKSWLNPDTTFTFIDPAGNYIKLPGSIKSAVFSTFDKIATDANQGYVPQTCHTPFGCLISFGIGGNGYVAHIVQDSFFAGYRSTIGGKGIYYTHRGHKVDSARFAESGVAVFLAKEGGGFTTLAGRFKSSLAGAKISKPGNGIRVLSMPVVAGSATGNYGGSSVREWLSGLEVSGKFKQIGGAWSPPGGYKKLWYLDQEYSLESFIEKKLNDKASFNDFITVFAYLSLSDEKLNKLLDCIGNKEIITDSIYKRINRREKQGGYFNYKKYVLDLQELLKKSGNDAVGIDVLRGLIKSNSDGAAFSEFFADQKKYNRCVLRQLTTKERIAIFDKICVDEDYWWVKAQNVLVDLLETRDTGGKEVEVLYLQGFRKNGYKWLREVWADEDVLSSKHRQRVLYAFIELFTQIEASRSDRITTRTNLYHDEKGLHEFTYPAGIQEYYIGLSGNAPHYQGLSELVGHKDGVYSRMEKDGRVYLNLWGTWRRNGAEQKQYITQKGDYSWQEKEDEVFYADSLWPLELINVVPCGDYKTMDIFRPGEVTTLPVLLVYFLERQRQKALESERDGQQFQKMIQGVVLVASVIAVPLSGGSSLALLNAAAACTDVAISELDEEINGVWAAMTEEERNAHKVGYRAWGNFRDVWHIGTAAVAIRGGAKVLKHFAGLLRFNTRFNNFVKSGSSFFAAISKKTFGKPFAVFNQRMGRFVGWGVNGAGRLFNVGDKILDLSIKQIRYGTNGKYALIGRSMGNAEMTGIRDIYLELKNLRKLDVEIFDASSLNGIWKSRFDEALTEFANATSNWTKKLSNQELLKLKMYNLNKEWALLLKSEGYTIIDMGDFNNLGFSTFYAMEKAIIFN
jgi:hypothetical protein